MPKIEYAMTYVAPYIYIQLTARSPVFISRHRAHGTRVTRIPRVIYGIMLSNITDQATPLLLP